MKKIISIILIIVLLITTFCFSSTATAVIDYTYKIDKPLADRFAEMDNDDTVDVSIWFKDISYDDIYEDTKNKLTKKVEKNKIAEEVVDLLSLSMEDVSQNAVLDKAVSITERKVKDATYDEVDYTNEVRKNISVIDAGKLIDVKREVTSDKYLQVNQKNFEKVFPSTKKVLFTEVEKEQPEILYIGKYAPNIEVSLTKAEVMDCISDENVDSVYLTEDFDPTEETEFGLSPSSENSVDINLVWQEITGIAEARDTMGLDGTGIKVGQIELTIPDKSLSVFANSVNNEKVFTYNENLSQEYVENMDIIGHTHGSYVASIMIGYEEGVYAGAIPNAELHSIATTAANGQWKNDIQTLLDKGVNLINASTGQLGTDGNTYGDASKWLDYIISHHNVNIFISSGNSSYISGSLAYNAITVGNWNDKNTETITDDAVADSSIYYTNGHYKPDVVAPGSCVGTGLEKQKTNGGTSAAAPVATAVAAQLLQRHPDLLALDSTLTKTILLNGATYKGEQENTVNSTAEFVAFDRKSGAGVVNITRSIKCFASRRWDVGTISSNDIKVSHSLSVTKDLNPVHITLCVKRNAYLNEEEPVADNFALFKLEVTNAYGDKKWMSIHSMYDYDNKNSLIFTPTTHGMYTVTITRIDNYEGSVCFAYAYNSQ